MIWITSKLKGQTFSLLNLETKLKPKGYVNGDILHLLVKGIRYF